MVVCLVWGTLHGRKEFCREKVKIELDVGYKVYTKSLISVAVPGR